ncbi:MAG: multiheme c-type cytochrome [Planctomycetota bacterium]
MPAPREDNAAAPAPWLTAALAVVALVLAVRAVSLAVGIGDTASEPAGESHRVAVAAEEPGPAADDVKQSYLSGEELAAIAGMCPTALSELPPELLPPAARRTVKADESLEAHRFASRGPAMPSLAEPRVAQAAPAPADGWLVDPDDWFVPEDEAAASVRPPDPSLDAGLPALPTPDDAVTPEPIVQPPSEASVADPLPPEPTKDTDTVDRGDVTPWPVDETLDDLEPAAPEAEQSQLPYYELPETEPTAEATAPAAPSVDQAFEADDAESEFESGPSFAPPGVATPDPEPPAPAFTQPTPEPGPELEADDFSEPPSEQVSDPLRWDGEYDSVVPETPRRVVAPPLPTVVLPPFEEDEGEKPQPVVEREELPSRDTQPRPETLPTSPTPTQRVPPEPKPEAVPVAPTPKRPIFEKPKAPSKMHPGGGAKAAAAARKAAGGKSADESHRELFARNNYPSALECAECHQRIYDEWSVSSHAYAFVSPMYHKFEQIITELSNGTVGHFCQRCHSPVATAMYEPRSMSLNDMAPAAQEGVTCIACHRVNQRWGKSNGDRRIEPGDIYAPIYGGVGGDGVAKAIADKKAYKVKTSPEEKGPGQAIHTEGRFFDQLTRAEACTSCHQVYVHPGIKLEVVWEQYRASPACKKGVTCQECHMGKVPGMAGGYNYGPVAELNGKTVNNHRKQSSHIFYGPGYSIAHPGVFPQNKDAMKWAFNDWLAYDWRAGWGTDEFEERMDDMEDRGVDTSAWFPKVWSDPDDRADAREIIEDNLDRLKTKRKYRELVMENGSKVDGPFFTTPPVAGRDLKFEYLVANQNDGHNLPTASLGAQPQLWANVVLIAPDGRRVWETGYTDSNGDLCDIHSVDVRHGRIPFDKQLFNLQTMFLITGATGTDREFYLPVNLDIDQVALLRPGNVPFSVLNHPPFIRMESRSLAPLGKKRVKYTVPAELMTQRGRYRLSFRLRSRTEPMYFMRLCKATPEMHRAMTEGTLDIHPQSVEFDVY